MTSIPTNPSGFWQKGPTRRQILRRMGFKHLPIPNRGTEARDGYRVNLAMQLIEAQLFRPRETFGQFVFQMGEGRLGLRHVLDIKRSWVGIGRHEEEGANLVFYGDKHISGLHLILYRDEAGSLWVEDQQSSYRSWWGPNTDSIFPLKPYLPQKIPEGVSYLGLADQASGLKPLVLKLNQAGEYFRLSTMFGREKSMSRMKWILNAALVYLTLGFMNRRLNRFSVADDDPSILYVGHDPFELRK